MKREKDMTNKITDNRANDGKSTTGYRATFVSESTKDFLKTWKNNLPIKSSTNMFELSEKPSHKK